MVPHKLLSKIFFALLLICFTRVQASETKWEVATLFLGNGEDSVFQNDIDQNILELSRINLNSNFNLGIYRELDGESINYFPNLKTNRKDFTLSDILYRKNLNHSISGSLTKSRTPNLTQFLKYFFKDPQTKKVLIVYSHGLGPAGLKNYQTKVLKNILSQANIHFDILWFDACFMANLEFLNELKRFSTYSIASEEAEFTAGMPFQYLNQLTYFNNTKEAALDMASNFIESYSYLKSGSQRSYVKTSSATISVIENSKLTNLIDPLKTISQYIRNLPTEDLQNLLHSLQRKYAMEDQSLVDVGSLLIQLRQLNRKPEIDALLTKAIRTLGIDSVKSLKQTIKLKVHSPEANAQLVYGFYDWSIDRAPENFMKADGIISGPKNHAWPYLIMNTDSKTLYPFFPGVYNFNYYFLNTNGKILTQVQTVSRTDDIVENKNNPSDSPIVYTAYTQQLGTKAERYTGLNISMPFEVPSLDYYELEFNQLAGWLRL